MKENIKQLLKELTLEEKAGLCSGKDFWRSKAVERLGIPSVMVSDGPSGLRTQNENGADENDSRISVSFPSGCATASSFDKSLLYHEGEILGEEANNFNVSTLLGPAINIKRSPLCGRNFEYLSEDPFLAGELGAAYINGVQSKKVGTSLKHFAANNQETNRFSESGIIDERTLREIYLAGFETCVKKSQPATIMCSYNAINGELSSENKWLLKDVLRDEWKYQGMVVSDWGAVYNRVKGIKAGLNLEMPYSGGLTDKDIVEAVKNGSLKMEELDDSVSHVLEWILNYVENKQPGNFDMEKDHEESGRIAEESCVLLKNDDGILPLSKNEKIVFVGYFVENPRYGGGGSSKIRCYKMTNALSAAESNGIKIEYQQGYSKNFISSDDELEKKALIAAEKADKVVFFAGLPESFESEGADRTNLDLPAVQNQLIEKLVSVNKNVVVVLHNGSPVAMPWIDRVKGVLECYLGGENVGSAQINLLFGKANPCGKLAETFPVKIEDTPCFMNFPGNGRETIYSEGIFVGYRWYDCRKMPVLFPFGFGLSYTTFEYEKIELSANKIKDVDGVDVFVTVKNTGKIDGKEIIQLYVADKTGVEIRPLKELKGFEKVFLKAGETKTVKITLNQRSFAYWNKDIGDWYAPSGEYEILVGASSADIRLSAKLEVVSSSKKAFTITPWTTMGDMLKNKEMAELISPKFKEACAGMDKMTDEEFEAKFPFPKVAMLQMILSSPFRSNRGKDGFITFEDIQKYVDDLNRKLEE